MNHEHDLGDVRYFGMQIGTVANRADPLGLSRVRVIVPGLIDEPSGWALPLGMPGGGKAQRGVKFVPRMGAEVAVFFKGGDPDAIYYIPAQWALPSGKSEAPITGESYPDSQTPEAASATPEDCDVIETEQWIVTLDNRPGKEVLRLKSKKFGDMVEIDGTTETGPGITIDGTAAVIIRSTGLVAITASAITLNGRTVTPSSSPI